MFVSHAHACNALYVPSHACMMTCEESGKMREEEPARNCREASREVARLRKQRQRARQSAEKYARDLRNAAEGMRRSRGNASEEHRARESRNAAERMRRFRAVRDAQMVDKIMKEAEVRVTIDDVKLGVMVRVHRFRIDKLTRDG